MEVPMRRLVVPFAGLVLISAAQPQKQELKPPPVVTPGAAYFIAPPSDATIFFDGESITGWTTRDGKPAAWKVADGAMTAVPKAGDIMSKEVFGDAQIHLEFMTPVENGDGQD